MQRSSVTLAKGCSTTRLGAPGETALPSGFSAQARHQRAVAQHQLARLVVGRGRQLQRAAADHQPVEHQPCRARRSSSVMSPPAAISGRAPLRAGDHDLEARRARRRDAVDLEDRRLAHRSGCRSISEPAAGGDRVQSRLQRRRRWPRVRCVASVVAVRTALVFAAADRARRSRSGRSPSSGPSARRAQQHAAALGIDADRAGGHRRLVVPADDRAAASRMSRRSQMRISLDGHRRRADCRDAAAPGFRRRRSRRRARRRRRHGAGLRRLHGQRHQPHRSRARAR